MKIKEFKKYPKYIPSGVEWIDKIPVEWNIKRTKWVYSESKERNREFNYQDEDLLSVSEYYGVAKRAEKIDNNDILNRAESLSENKVVKKGELVINIMLAWKKGLGSSNFKGIVSPSYCVYRLKNVNDEPRYFHYLYRTDLYAESFRRFSRGIIESRLRLYSEEFFNILTILPTPDEQTAIANYLDDKTAKIDSLIEKKKKLIELLKEERTAVINQAVTQGINPDVKLKESGIDWLDNASTSSARGIPEHWEVKKLKYVAHIFRGKFTHRPRNDERLYNGKFPFIQTGEVAKAEKYLTSYTQTLNEEGFKVSTQFPKGTLLMTIAANIGEVAILGIDACFPDSIVGFYPFGFIDNEFLFYKLKAMTQVFLSTSVMNTQMNLNVDRISFVSISFPSIQEQTQIVQHIETETKRIAGTISKIEKEIELLAEYRTALISEVVTGKIKIT